MSVMILLSSLSGCERYAPVMAPVNTGDENVSTWKTVTLLFIEDCNRLKSSLMTTETRPNAVAGQLAPMASRHNLIQRKVGVSRRCYNCNNRGHFSQEFTAPHRNMEMNVIPQDGENLKYGNMRKRQMSNNGEAVLMINRCSSLYGVGPDLTHKSVRNIENETDIIIDTGASEHNISKNWLFDWC